MRRIAVTGASGRTGWRIVQEARGRGLDVTAVLRPGSEAPDGLGDADIVRLELGDRETLEKALEGCDALVIATGARPSPDLFGPLRVDALSLRPQLDACRATGIRRIVLVSSLCSGRWFHPLNIFGLVLVWKGVAERELARSGLDWTVIRPGGLKETEEDLDREGILFSGPGEQDSGSIPRRLVARVCLDALQTPDSIGRIVEVTSRPTQPTGTLAAWLTS